MNCKNESVTNVKFGSILRSF